ncbi:potassium channel family protein [Tengunoibacter tsumagoiensis]|uniref:Potassium channel domain-containing protein n=1 Tax=Tengunoibacter tsumagoiensis TaxID=2014871 RepID=A0A401ZVP1_9CHLR|nr:potassium channel family protein [Tengunoibacter tsumagoiensis]GCE10963.1 hypothetical protein KTT_08220 [Tengunoibacter tsumagoiensis]
MVVNILLTVLALLLIFVTLLDGFETIVLPRRVDRKLRMARLFYRTTWQVCRGMARKIKSSRRREYILSIYGPFSLILLLALWACLLILAFALLQYSMGSTLSAPEHDVTFATDLYLSGTTFFTLGLGDVYPRTGLPRFCTVCEAGMGIAFLALIIGYVPVIYQAFSRRESQISLLDARAGSPPSAAEFLRRHLEGKNDPAELLDHLRSWERWSADILESHLSYPVLTYYRSQHERQSWLSALTTILDVSALLMIELDGIPAQVGRFTFAIARHTAVDLVQAFGIRPIPPETDRLSTEQFKQLCTYLHEAGLPIQQIEMAEDRVAELRAMYEPFVNALARFLLLPLPEWLLENVSADDWQTSAWDHFSLVKQRPLNRLKATEKTGEDTREHSHI